MKTLIAFLLLTATALGEMVLPKPIDFPIAALRKAYVPTERFANDFSPKSFSQMSGPFVTHTGTDLIIRDLDGTVRTLVVGHQPEKGLLAVHDYCVSLDGTKVFYSHVRQFPETKTLLHCDIFVVPAVGGEPTQLTDARTEFSPPSGAWPLVLPFPLTRGVWNAMPCDTPEGLVFGSTRNGVKSPVDAHPAFQLFTRDHDTGIVNKIGHMNLGGVLDPIYFNGRIYFASGEHQGHRGSGWGIWSIKYDGTDWQPFISDIWPGSSSGYHISTFFSDGSFGTENYYDRRTLGMPFIVPPFEATPFGPPSPFGNPIAAQNDKIWAGFDVGQTNAGSGNSRSFPFQRHGMYNPLPMMHMTDKFNTNQGPEIKDPATVVVQREAGHLSGVPGNAALCSWTGNLQDRRQWQVCLIPDITAGLKFRPPVLPPSDDPLDYMVPVLNDPGFQFWYGKAVVPYEQIYGTPPPAMKPSPVATELPDGSPYCVVGTSDMGNEITLDGKALVSFDPEKVHGVRVVHFNPTQPLQISIRPHHRDGFEGFSSVFDERVAFYNQIIWLRKYTTPEGKMHVGPNPPAGSTLILRSDGKPDLSFLAELPADQPFTFQPVDENGQAIADCTAKTWHQGRPMEKRVDCRGCHKHWKPDQIPFEETAAARPDYPRFKLTKVRTVEYHRDLKEADERLGLGIGPMPWVVIGANSSTNPNWVGYNSQKNPILNDPRLLAEPETRKLFADWQDSGMMAAQPFYVTRGGDNTQLITPETQLGPYADNVPPTLCLTFRTDRTLIGACDPQSGLNEASLSIKSTEAMAGRAAGAELADLCTKEGDVWTLLGEPKGIITASIRDNQRALDPTGKLWSEEGNITGLVRTVKIETAPL